MKAYRGRLAAAALTLAAAALTLALTGCGHVLPLGPEAPSRLAVPITLQLVLSQPPRPAGGCQAGYAALSAPGSDFPGVSGACYRKIGTAVSVTSATVALYFQPAGGEPVQHPAMWGLAVTVPGAGAATLTAITTKSYDTQDPLAISIAGTTWAVLMTDGPVPNGRFVLPTQSKDQALQLERTLMPSD